MAGYSAKALPDKLGVKQGMRIAVLGAPDGFELTPVAPGVTAGRLRPDLDLVMFFTTKHAELTKRWPALTGSLTPGGSLWVCWPKKSSGRITDMTEDVIRQVALPTGWVDTKVCAVDDVWSGLRCVLRVELRPTSVRQ
ncbi:MAG: DUF3052 domain-containing protein [Acidimicrobiales bacterium]